MIMLGALLIILTRPYNKKCVSVGASLFEHSGCVEVEQRSVSPATQEDYF